MSGYHFVEVMTCPGGCISGAGQPDCGSVPVSDEVRRKRIQSLYQADERAERRNSMDNPEIGTIYHEFFKEPLSLLSEKLLLAMIPICFISKDVIRCCCNKM